MSCKNTIVKPDNSSAIECANSFIRCLFRGDFEAAAMIMTTNKESTDCLQKYKFNYKQIVTKSLKAKYKKASVIITKDRDLSETESIYSFKDPVSNTSPPPIKVVKKGESWYIDYGYSCSGNL